MLFSGYIYWLILSKITEPSSIGLASTIIAFATIVFSIASIGVAGWSTTLYCEWYCGK